MNHFRNETASDLILSLDWISYFENNTLDRFPIPWDSTTPLSDDEYKAIARSISIFQLGESSDAKAFKRAAERYVGESGDVDYLYAHRLFVEEEHLHAALLKRFMDRHDIPTRTHSWSDTVFRLIRRGRDLEHAILILVTAEFIARIYYDALRDATRSPILRTICDQILQDERAHIKFQCQRIAILRHRQLRPWIWCKTALYRSFFTAACLVVWCDHRKVFNKARIGFTAYMRSAYGVLNPALTEMQPRKTTTQAAAPCPIPEQLHT